MTYRHRISFDDLWEFQIDPENHPHWNHITAWRKAVVPLPWQAQFNDLRHYRGAAWYRHRFNWNDWPAGLAVVHFNAVDYHATVWLNGQHIGEHEGGYLPFEFDFTDLLEPGENDLIVKVIDPDDDHHRWPNFPFSQIPHGKQSWYGPIGGIWQSVWLERRPATHLQFLRLTPDPKSGAITCLTALNAPPGRAAYIEVEVRDPAGRSVAQARLNNLERGVVQLNPASVVLWSPETPQLYEVTATLFSQGQAVDQLSERCGFRTIEARDGRIYLNDKPIYLRGVLDQAYYPETIYTPPNLEFLEDQLRKAKALGLNCLRCHIKIEDPRYYEVADRLGMLIWTEIPNWIWLTPQTAVRAKETFRQMVERDWNHPSIIAWTLINENWGTDLVHNPEHRRWLAEFYHEAKALDPTRLIVDNSACCDNLHVAGDIEDFHHYRAIPDHAREWDEWVADFASRADWAWAEDHAHERRADLPLIVSEFGNWGLPQPDQIQESGHEPWWFETGFAWGDGIVYPHGFKDRFAYWQLDQVFGSFDNFIAAHQRHMARSLAYEIASMRLLPAIGGYVITEFTDVHWECNGLLDMQRHVKQHLDDFIALNQDRVVVIRPERWSGRPGEQLLVQIRAFDVDGAGKQGGLYWKAGANQGEVPADGGTVEIALPTTGAGGILPIKAQWRSAEGKVWAQGQVEVAWVAPVVAPTPLNVVDDPALAAWLKQAGYHVVDAPASVAAVLVARRVTADLRQAIQQGHIVVLLAGAEAEEGGRLAGFQVVPRAGTNWQGDWATAYSWLNRSGPFANLPGEPLLDMPYANLMPEAVITGMRSPSIGHYNWAGLALGWMHKPASLLLETHYGQGRLVMTTFNLTATTLADNVLGQNLFSGILQLAATA